MERQKQMIELSLHVQKKLEQQNSSSEEFSSDETPTESYLSSKPAAAATPKAERSILLENYEKQRHCSKCSRREKVFQVEHERFHRLAVENANLMGDLRSTVSSLRHYREENLRLRNHLKKIETHLDEYRTNFDHLKKEILDEKKPNPKIFVAEDADETERRFEHLKRLRYEIEMYNRLTAAKEKQQQEKHEIRRKPIQFQF